MERTLRPVLWACGIIECGVNWTRASNQTTFRLQRLFVLSPIVPAQSPRQPPTITSSDNGIRLTVDEQNDLAALRVLLPGQPDSDPGILVIFLEHVTARELGKVDSQHLYLFRPGRQYHLSKAIPQKKKSNLHMQRQFGGGPP